MLLKNDGSALPLDPARTSKVAVVGPLADTLYTDWYGGDLPYQVTPLGGITRAARRRRTVTGSEGVDRIALKDVPTGRYVTATGTTDADPVARRPAPTAGAAAQFDVFDWGQGVVTLRNAANGRYLGYNWRAVRHTTTTSPTAGSSSSSSSWSRRPTGQCVLRYAGYETD